MNRNMTIGGHVVGASLALALMGGASSALAAPITFFGEDTSTAGVLGTNSAQARTDFLANLTGVGNEDFESFFSGSSSPLNLSFPGSSGSLSATLTGTGVIAGSPAVGRFATSGTKYLEVSTGSFVIDFLDPVSAFGFNGIDIGDFVTNQMVLKLTNTLGDTTELTVPHSLGIGNLAQATLFFGFYDLAQSFTSIEFTNAGGGDLFAFDDMVIGDAEQVTPTPVPEPATLALLGLGLLGLGARRRLFSRSA